MLTDIVKEELRKIMSYSTYDELKSIEIRFVPGDHIKTSREDTVEDILSSVSQPSDILRHQSLRKRVLSRYLSHYNLSITQDQRKLVYIRICLEMWHATEDRFLLKLQSDDRTSAAMNSLEDHTKERLKVLKRRFYAQRSSTEILRAMQNSSTLGSMPSAPAFMAQAPVSSFSRLFPSDPHGDDASITSSVEIIECSPDINARQSPEGQNFLDTMDLPPTRPSSRSTTASSGKATQNAGPS